MEEVQKQLTERSLGKNKRRGRKRRKNRKMRPKEKDDGIWGEWEDRFFVTVMIGQSSGGVSAASEYAHYREKKMEFSQGENKTVLCR